MSALSKTALKAAFEALPTPITRTSLETLFDNTVDSYQDTLPQLTEAQIAALTPTLNQLVFNTDRNYIMQYNGTIWATLVAMFIGTTAQINASTPKAGQLFYDTDLDTLSFGDGVTHIGVQTDECTCVQTVKVTLSSAQILNSFTTNIQLIAAPGAGKFIDVHSIVIKYNYVTSQYATNTSANIYIGNSNYTVCNNININFSENTLEKLAMIDNIAPLSDLANKALIYEAITGNPTAGDGTIDVHITYTVITL